MKTSQFKQNFKGVMTLLPTPFKTDFELDLCGLRQHVNYLIESGIKTLIPTGSTGEFSSLSIDERKKVVEAVIDEANSKAFVIVGTAHSSTKVAVELAKHAEDVGADGLMIVQPYYLKPSDEGLYIHYKTIADSVDIGIMLYNNPHTTKICFSFDLLGRLFEVGNIIAIKEVSYDPFYFSEVVRLFGNQIYVLASGEDEFALWAFQLGSPGTISLASNILPAETLAFYQAGFVRKNYTEAWKLANRLGLFTRIWKEKQRQTGTPAYIHCIKAAMNLLGRPAGPVRPPLAPLKEEEIEKIKKVLVQIGLITGS